MERRIYDQYSAMKTAIGVTLVVKKTKKAKTK